ncbi:hypothetical protein [Mailhella sp.]|uniref:hypothetical protein n=1 Tax=Mailhella sp. TaxID=1981029 RepID=UPI004063526B
MSGFLPRMRRWLSAGFCAALTAAVVCMAAAVLIQALAVLVIALLAASLLLPHPLKWYAKEGAEAVRLFVSELLAPPHGGEHTASAENGESVPPAKADEQSV